MPGHAVWRTRAPGWPAVGGRGHSGDGGRRPGAAFRSDLQVCEMIPKALGLRAPPISIQVGRHTTVTFRASPIVCTAWPGQTPAWPLVSPDSLVPHCPACLPCPGEGLP